MKILILLVYLGQVASVTEIKRATAPQPGTTAGGRGALGAGSRRALRAAMFAARAGGRWNLLPLPDPKEPNAGEGLLGSLQKTSVLRGL